MRIWCAFQCERLDDVPDLFYYQQASVQLAEIFQKLEPQTIFD